MELHTQHKANTGLRNVKIGTVRKLLTVSEIASLDYYRAESQRRLGLALKRGNQKQIDSARKRFNLEGSRWLVHKGL